jgi:hypothetical protein
MATTAAPAAANSSNISTLSDWAGPYVTNMLGQTEAYANSPYQVYGGPMTAGQSDLQSKVFQGLGGLNFPSNLGASFSSSGAYQPPRMNMDAYKQSPIGTGPQPGMTLNQGSNGFGDFGPMQATTGLQNQGPAQHQTYEDYINGLGMAQVVPATREQFEAGQKMQDDQRRQGMDMLGRGDMNEIMAGLGGQPGQMPQGGLAGLLGRMPQQPQQPQQNIAQQYMNPYLQSVLTPQLEELRRQNDITNMNTNAKFTGAGAYGGGRQAIMNAENNRNLMQEMNKTVGTGYANAYDKAMGQFNTEQGQAKTLADMMAGAGATQRGIEQEGITADYNEFLNQRDYPQKMLQFKQSMLQGLPIATTTNQAAPMSGIGQLTSTIGGMGNIIESLKKFNLAP